MRESFFEYKKTLDSILEGVNYLYSGDVISSDIRYFTQKKSNPLTSPSFIIDSIKFIYDESLTSMIQKSEEIIIPKEGIDSSINFIEYLISKSPFKPSFIFCSNESKKLLHLQKKIDSTKTLPSYFYSIEKYIGLNVDIFLTPLIDDEDGNYSFYITDGPIQSLVYSIQNMEYNITPIDETNTEWEHKMQYNFYDCKYKSIKIELRNVSKIRDSKINDILSGD